MSGSTKEEENDELSRGISKVFVVWLSREMALFSSRAPNLEFIRMHCIGSSALRISCCAVFSGRRSVP